MSAPINLPIYLDYASTTPVDPRVAQKICDHLTLDGNFGNPASCTYYYMNNCGHCTRFTPEWDQFVKTYTGPVKLKKVEASEAGNDLKKYNIQGFPTVLFLDDDGNSKIYEGPRTSQGLNKFISENTN